MIFINKDYYRQYINQKFGELTVVDITNNGKRYMFNCNCSCGTINKIVQPCDIFAGKVKTCGRCSANKLVGTRIYKLDIISIDDTNGVKLKCQCDCGNIVYYRAAELNTGRIHSCGKCPINHYETKEDCVIGYTAKNEPFYFDLEDYDKIKQYSWRLHHSGYVVTSLPMIDGHREILTMHQYICGEHKQKIDHINRNKQDNRKSNLRLVSNSLNGFNIDLQSNNTSGKTGVSYLKKNNTYMVYIGHDNQNIYLGCYKSFDEAVKVRQQAELKYFGELSDTKEITKSKDTNKESLQFPVFVGLREIGKEVSYE